ncbi:MAG: chitobiase/beta-hexosaminidase C-terminal domain-containing protein [Thermodesulfobacteriota bacterium]
MIRTRSPISRALLGALAFAVAVLLVAAGCGSSEDAASGFSRVSVVLSPGKTAARTAAAVPGGVREIRVSVSGPGMDPLQAAVEVSPDDDSVALTLDVPAGPQRVFVVQALGADGAVLYQGSAAADLWGQELALTIALELVIQGTVATPAFTPPEGTYTEPQLVSLSTATPDAEIRYNVDDVAPTPATGLLYAEPVLVDASATLRAIAYREGWADSEVAEATYTITGTVATPVFSPPAGIYTEIQEVTLSSATPEAEIRYTVDGGAPTRTTGLVYTGPIPVDATATLRAIAFREAWADSPVAEATYTITGTVATPAFSPPAGTYTAPQLVALSSDTPGAAIRYTVNGEAPTSTSGTVYSEPIPVDATATLRAIAYRDGWADSPVAVATYAITGTVAAPVFDPPGGIIGQEELALVTLTTATPGAQIRYTVGDVLPTRDAGTLYDGPIDLFQFQFFEITVNAIAFLEGWNDSPVVGETYIVSALGRRAVDPAPAAGPSVP